MWLQCGFRERQYASFLLISLIKSDVFVYMVNGGAVIFGGGYEWII